MRTFQTKTLIQAPAERIWALLVDAPGYPSWNTTIDKLEGRIGPGEKLKVHAKLSPGRAFPVRVTEFDRNQRMVWTGGMPLGLFKGVRTFTMVPKGNAVEFAMREVFSGPLARLIEGSLPDMQPAFDEFAAALKARAETKS
jgi:uncharacterized protein YndB with AHSA1/START domain